MIHSINQFEHSEIHNSCCGGWWGGDIMAWLAKEGTSENNRLLGGVGGVIATYRVPLGNNKFRSERMPCPSRFFCFWGVSGLPLIDAILSPLMIVDTLLRQIGETKWCASKRSRRSPAIMPTRESENPRAEEIISEALFAREDDWLVIWNEYEYW